MRWWLLLGVVGCSSSPDPSRPPDRERDVLIEAPADVTVIYRDGDGAWQLAPQVGNRLGFDLDSDRYAVAFLDVAHRQTESVFTTLAEQADFTVHPKVDPEAHQITGTVSGLGELGGTIATSRGRNHLAGPAAQPYALDVLEGQQTVVAGSAGIVGSMLTSSSLAVRRDLLITGPLAIDIDLATEGIPTTDADLNGPEGCNYRSTFSFAGTEVVTANGRHPIVVAPHRDQWQATDRLFVDVVCGNITDAVIQTQDIGSPELASTTIEVAPPSGPAAVTRVGQDFRFQWSTYETPTAYEGVVIEPFCDTLDLLPVRDIDGGTCVPRVTVRVTPGWADTMGLQLDPMPRAELEALGVWDPVFEVPAPQTWMLAARRDRNGVSSHAVRFGKIEE